MTASLRAVLCLPVIPKAPGAESRMNKLFGHAETAIQRLFSFAGTRGDTRGPRANGRLQTGMKFEIVQFLLTFSENVCYTVAGLVSCFLEKSPCIPMLRGDHVPVPIASRIEDVNMLYGHTATP
jgi:hypothetical protein